MKSKNFQSLTKNILPSLPGYISKGPLTFATPLNHILKGFYFESSSFSSEKFFIWIFVLPLYVPCTHISFNIGRRLGSQWNVTTKNLISKLEKKMIQEGLPFLDKITTPKNIACNAPNIGQPDDPYVCESIFYSHVFESDIRAALKSFDKLCSLLSERISWQGEILSRAQKLREAMDTDINNAHDILIKWEVESVNALRLTKYYKNNRKTRKTTGLHI